MLEIIKDTYQSLFSKLTLTIWAIATVGTVLAGPFGTFDSMSLLGRVIYWPMVTSTSLFFGYLAYALTRVFIRDDGSLLFSGVAGILGTLFVASNIGLLSALISTERVSRVEYMHLMGWVGFVFFSIILGRFMFQKTISSHLSKYAPEPIIVGNLKTQVGETSHPRILDRLPKAEHGKILRLSANDHFVHIVTEAGEHPVRMRLRDAISEMDGIEGSLVHRSHWVAHDTIHQQDKDQGKVQVILKNGDRVPVSRNYRDVLDRLNVPLNQSGEEEPYAATVQ